MLRKNLIANSLNQILGVGFPIITQIYLIRHLDLVDIGFWNVLIAAQSIVVLCVSFTGLYAIRELSTTDNFRQHSRCVTNVLSLDYVVLLLPLSICLLYLLYVYPGAYHVILISFLPLLTTPLGAEYYFQATLRNDFILYRRVFSRTFFVVLLFIFVDVPSEFLVFAYIASLTITLEHLINFAVVRRLLNHRELSLRELRRILCQSIRYLPFKITYNTLPQISILVGSKVLQGEALAVFSILMKVVNLATTLVSSSVMVIFPYRLNRRYARASQQAPRDGYFLYLLLTALVGAVVVIGLIVSADLIVLLFLNDQTVHFNRFEFFVLACYVLVHALYNYVVYNHFFERDRVKEVILSNVLIIVSFVAMVLVAAVVDVTAPLAPLVVLSALCPTAFILEVSFRERRSKLVA